MINLKFYKLFRFWAALILLYLSSDVYPRIFNGDIFKIMFWQDRINIVNIIDVIIAIAFLIQVLFFTTEKQSEQ